MATKVQNLFDANGEMFYPLTHVKAVVNDSGENVEQLLEAQNEKLVELAAEVGIETLVSLLNAGDTKILQGRADNTGHIIAGLSNVITSPSVKVKGMHVAVPKDFVIRGVLYYNNPVPNSSNYDSFVANSTNIAWLDQSKKYYSLLIGKEIGDASVSNLLASLHGLQDGYEEAKDRRTLNGIVYRDNVLINPDYLIENESTSWKTSTPTYLNKGDIVSIKSSGSNSGLITKSTKRGEIVDVILRSDGTGIYTYTIQEEGIYLLSYRSADVDAFVEINGEVSIALLDKVAKLEHENVDDKKIAWIDGFLINASTNRPQPSSAWRYSEPIALKEGDNVEIRTSGGGVALLSRVNKDGAITEILITSSVQNPSQNTGKYTYTIGKDGYYIISYKYLSVGAVVMINDEDVCKNQSHLDILVLGNSYTADAWTYIPAILKDYGITCNIVLYCRGALSLENLYNRWNAVSAQDIEEGVLPGTYQRIQYNIDTRYMTAWQTLDRGQLSAKMLTEMKDWDIIDITQMSVAALDINNYIPWANKIISELLQDSMRRPYTLMYNQPWTRESADRPEDNMSATVAFSKIAPYNVHVPTGTAIFNARENDTLVALGDTGQMWDDLVHLQEGLPKYIASMVVAQCIFDTFFSGRSIINNKFRPTEEVLNSWAIPQRRSSSTGVTEDNCYLAQKAAIMAIRYPMEIIEI